jgi:uncharacterized protein (UPF0276 family)
VKFAVNYSSAAADLFHEGRIWVDLFKCPAWPEAIASARALAPVYVHLPLRVGAGIGDAIDTETRQPADWRRLETLLGQTGTPQINVHLAPLVDDFPGIPVDTGDPAHSETLYAHALHDVQALVARFGPERVVVENADDGKGLIYHAALQPVFVQRVIEEAGCSFLLDIAHARLAAHTLGRDAREYLAGLPTGLTSEIHLAGIQSLTGRWLALMKQSGLSDEDLGWFAGLEPGQWLDHLPLVDDDWEFYAWAFEQVRRGDWGRPWVTTLEHGGVGRTWEMLTDRDALAEQVPRLYRMVKDLGGGQVDNLPYASADNKTGGKGCQR